MDKYATNELIIFIHNTFSKNTPNEKRLSFYFDELYWIDEGAIERIKEHFRKAESCPSNIVREIKYAYAEWKRDLKINKPRFITACKTCNNTGYLKSMEPLTSKHAGTKLYPCTWTCPFCSNWEGGPWEITERCNPPQDVLIRCQAPGEAFDADYMAAMEDVLKTARGANYAS